MKLMSLLFIFFVQMSYADLEKEFNAKSFELKTKIDLFKEVNAKHLEKPEFKARLFELEAKQEELSKEYCSKDKKFCSPKHRKDEELKAAIAAIKNQKDVKDEVKDAQIEAIERVHATNYCVEHNRDCELLTEADKTMAELKKKRKADSHKLEEELKSKKGEASARDKLIKFENESHALLSKTFEELCEKSEKKDIIYCGKEKGLKFLNESNLCQIERIHQLHAIIKDGASDREAKLVSKHEDEFDGDCSKLLKVDKAVFSNEANAKKVVKPEVKSEPKTEVKPEPTVEVSSMGFDANSCEWVDDLPRKVLLAPGCGKGPTKVCSGYVVCNQKQGGGKFVRASTCGPEYCGNTKRDAINCTKQAGYSSKKPDSEDLDSISPKLQKFLSIGTPQ